MSCSDNLRKEKLKSNETRIFTKSLKGKLILSLNLELEQAFFYVLPQISLKISHTLLLI